MDMGLGNFMGVDGPEFRPGNTWGHAETAGSLLTVGEHEWEVLGFEDCCDGHAELEVHLSCDTASSPWRLVSHGDTVCLNCDLQDPVTEGPVIDGVQHSCSSETPGVACCRQEGNGCNDMGSTISGACSVGGAVVCTACDDPNMAPTGANVGRFVAVGREMTHSDAIGYCENNYQSLASIGSWDEQQQAVSACSVYSTTASTPGSSYGCWIGLQDIGQEGQFSWLDGASMTFVRWAPSEPNNRGGGGNNEDAVDMDFRNWGNGRVRQGEFNDEREDAIMFPLCETSIPAPDPSAPSVWGGEQTSTFRIRVCIDHQDDVSNLATPRNLSERVKRVFDRCLLVGVLPR